MLEDMEGRIDAIVDGGPCGVGVESTIVDLTCHIPRLLRPGGLPLEALEAVLARDVIFEINTGAVARGYRPLPYPAPFLLDAIRQKGGRVCITSDSHRADTIVHAFPQAAALAGSCGFREAWILAKNGFQPVGLPAWNP